MDMKLFLGANWDRVTGWAGILLGCVSIWIGWYGVSGTALSYEQMPYLISGGIFGLALIALGSTMLLSADLRDEWRKLDKLEETIHRAGQVRVGPPTAGPAAPEAVGTHAAPDNVAGAPR